MANIANQSHDQLATFECRAAILVMLVLADSEVRLRVYNASVEVASFDEWYSMGVVVAGIHDANSNATVFGEKVAKCDDVPVIG